MVQPVEAVIALLLFLLMLVIIAFVLGLNVILRQPQQPQYYQELPATAYVA